MKNIINTYCNQYSYTRLPG